MLQHPGRFAFWLDFFQETDMDRITVKTLKPRNPFVAVSHMRAAGSHRRSAGGQRQGAQRALQRELLELPRHRHSP